MAELKIDYGGSLGVTDLEAVIPGLAMAVDLWIIRDVIADMLGELWDFDKAQLAL